MVGMNVPDLLVPILPDLSLGGLLGFCAGYAFKKAGRVVVFVIGAVFVIVQFLAYYELVTVNWARVQVAAEPWLKEGASTTSAWVLEVLQANLPFGGAFVAGLVLGLRAK